MIGETASMMASGRSYSLFHLEEWLAAAAHPRTVRVIPITAAVSGDIASLPASFHHDPADRLIVATSRVLKLPLLTRDKRIVRSRFVSRGARGR